MGEVDSGYGRAVKFQKACHALNYPFFFKAVPGMGHDNDRGSRQLATVIFEYVRSLPKDPVERVAKYQSDAWAAPFVGDWLNQVMEPGENREEIPARLRIALPTALLAKAWARESRLTREEDPAERKPKKLDADGGGEEGGGGE
jgi:hypothetical protein